MTTAFPPSFTNDAVTTSPSGRPLTHEEQEAIAELRARTREAWDLKQRYSQCAQERRDAIAVLRSRGWSFRRIGETIGVSGQRVDSMIRLGERRAPDHNGDDSAVALATTAASL